MTCQLCVIHAMFSWIGTVYGHEKTHHDLYIYSLCLKQTAIQVMVPGFPV